MEQFRQIGEALGSMRALMAFRHEIKINHRQCELLLESFTLAFDSLTDHLTSHLKFDAKWKPLEIPLKELHKIFREGESYIRNCLEPRDFWGKAISSSQSTESVELHLHNLLWCVPIVIEAIEAVSEVSGGDQEDVNRKKLMLTKKYDIDWMDPSLFQHKFGKLYLINQEMCKKFDSVIREDGWLLTEMINEKKGSSKPMMSKKESRLSEVLLGSRNAMHPCSLLVGSPDYQVKRRLDGSRSKCKEIQWLGENFAMRHVIGEAEVELMMNEVPVNSSLAHPNVMSYLYAFRDEEKKEGFVLMDLMSKDLASYIKEVCSPKRRVPFSLLVAVDMMLQVARGMEYLHAKKIYHGELNPSNILVKPRSSAPDGYLLVKVANFGLTQSKKPRSPTNQTATNPCIWYAPEVLGEQEQSSSNATNNNKLKYSEKADVYSFAMICFELLTGKIPFEESHLQGDKMSRNIRAGERPLFPFPSPKYLASLTKRCWQADPLQRPSFSSICRMLRYIKRFLVINPDVGQPEAVNPLVDYFDVEVSLMKRLLNWGRKESLRISEIPFEMYAYRVMERERTNANFVKERSSDSGSERASVCGEENGLHGILLTEDSSLSCVSPKKSLANNGSERRKISVPKKIDVKLNNKQTGQPQQQQKVRMGKSSPLASCARRLRGSSDSHLQPVVMSPRRRASGHASD